MTTWGDFRAVVTLNGRRDARPYKEPIALVVAGFQPAILASKDSMSLGASEASCGSPEVRSETESINACPTLWGPFDSLVGLVRSG